MSKEGGKGELHAQSRQRFQELVALIHLTLVVTNLISNGIEADTFSEQQYSLNWWNR